VPLKSYLLGFWSSFAGFLMWWTTWMCMFSSRAMLQSSSMKAYWLL
jgi:hypothetical protein